VFLFANISIAFAQQSTTNLVPNGTFENHKNKSNNITNAIPWKNVGTVDYFMGPEKNDTSRFKGAHRGLCYAGLRFQKEYREYMYVQLTEPLEKGVTYHFKMYARLLSNSTVSLKQLGVYFSEDPFKYGMKFFQEEQLDTSNSKGINTLNWVPVQGDFVAKGGEKYIIIGNFADEMKKDMVNRKVVDAFKYKEAYYFVDDITLKRKSSGKEGDAKKGSATVKDETTKFPETFEIGQSFILKNIAFANGTATLLKESDKTLNKLVTVLNNHPFMEVQINGHMEKTGNEAAALKLTKDRAKAIYHYLKDAGVVNPITYKGCGSSRPIAPNDTDKNKAMNRRMELVIIKP